MLYSAIVLVSLRFCPRVRVTIPACDQEGEKHKKRSSSTLGRQREYLAHLGSGFVDGTQDLAYGNTGTNLHRGIVGIDVDCIELAKSGRQALVKGIEGGEEAVAATG